MRASHHDSDSDLPFTGERYVPHLNGGIALEHWHRYLLARDLAAGKAVLDIACGEGYGSALLSEVAASVIGVDISPDAVAHAGRRYPGPTFLEGNCAEIPVADASIDLVVSFETLEHHDQHEKMFAEIKRVLKPGGLLIMSSPDRLEYSDIGHADNTFHVKELYRDEFEALVNGHFANFALFGQRIVFGSGIFREDAPSQLISYTLPEQGENDPAKAPGMARPLYFIAIASDAPLPPLASGFFEQRLDLGELAVCWQKMDADLTDSRVRKIAELSETIAAMRLKADQAERDLADLKSRLTARPAGLSGLIRALFGGR